MSHWSTALVGLTIAELGNCWGLVKRVFVDVHGIALDDYDIDAGAKAAIAEAIGAAKQGPVWFPAASPRAFDVAVFMRGRFESHVGVVVRPGMVLHVSARHDALIERYGTGMLTVPTGFWRHARLGDMA